MNRSLKLSMLMALALGSSQVMALDLGQIQVKSALGQPLLAEIPLHPANPAELQNLTVQLASSEEFARAGVAGGRTSIPLSFSVTHTSGGSPVIRITSSAPVDDPFLDLLIEVNGKAGKSVREYAVLLDPPNAPAATTAAVPAPAPPAASRPAAAKAPGKATAPAAPVAAAPAKPVSRPKPAPAAPALAASAAGNGQVGPVERGQTLSGIARNVTPAGVDVQQMMLALQQANPNAFYRSNINALKSGVVLRVPTSAEAQAMTIAAAAAEVRRQNGDWRAGTPGKPAVVANAATRASDTGAPAGAPETGDRLTLVPAKAGSGAGTPGGGAAGNGLHQELLRTKESLASLEQQSADLKARLKDLGDINSKNERLLSLKDSEIAELQAKLAAARKSAGTPAAAVPAPAVAAAKTAAPPSAATLETAIATAGTATGTHAAVVPAAAGSAPHATSPATTSSVVTTPLATPAPAAPVEKPAARQQPHAPVVEEPWYMQAWAQAAGAAAVLLLILLALLGRRRRKPAEAAATSKSAASLADRFGSAPGGDSEYLPGDDVDQEELLDQLAEHPDDIGLHLELVTLYYSRRDVEHFEAAAEAMYAHITDPQQDEWQDVLHMGEDLVPGHPLFDHHAVPPAHKDAHALGEFDIDDYAHEDDASAVASSMPPLPPGGPKKVSEYNFNFDLTRAAAETPARPGADDATMAAPLAREPAPAPAPASAPAATASGWHFDDADDAHLANVPSHDLSEFSDDPVDTKLDLARAYIDMGDAEGARAMLDEVVKEGSQMQRDVAKRLLDGMH